MVRLKIDNREVTAGQEMTVLEAAAMAGIDIPAMCHNSESGHFASCMVCLVRERNSSAMMPSCSIKVKEGMDIITTDEEIEQSRKTAIELLLSEHIGDCEAPCRIACPANMDIPLMNTWIARGMPDKALSTVMRDIAFPSVLGRICPAPCEGACHRKRVDAPVSVCILKRYAGDNGTPQISPAPPTGRKVAVIGAGIAGLTAAFYLQLKGHACTVFDNNPLPGGALRNGNIETLTDKSVLDREVGVIIGTGVVFRGSSTVDKDVFSRLAATYDAVLVATGGLPRDADLWGLDHNGKQISIDKQTWQTSRTGIFAAGNIVRSGKLAIRSAAQGKEAAWSINLYLEGSEPSGEPKLFNSRIGRLQEAEFAAYMSQADDGARLEPGEGPEGGFTPGEAAREAKRCMHCECLKPVDCALRILAGRYGASQRRFSLEERKQVKKYIDHDQLIYEPGKCIKCGICVRLTAKKGENPGLTFMGRGYDVEIAVPFEESLAAAIKNAAPEIAAACPTGAIATREEV